MTSHLTQEMERLFALTKRLCEGNEIEINESHEVEGVSVMFISYSLHEYMVTLEGSGEEMMLCVRSVEIPELYVSLPPPAFVRFGEMVTLEELC